MSGNRSKKNGKKSKFLNIPEVLQVKSVKLETGKSCKDGKNSTKSENNLRQHRRPNILKNVEEPSEGADELEASLTKKFKGLIVNEDGEKTASTSVTKANVEDPCADSKKSELKKDDDIPLVMEYCPESTDEAAGKPDQQFACTYKYYTKNTKSIKFTNQVTVLYFNGEEILCESMEPLKKEQDQQLRNKEMRKEHLLSKGQIDNLYLF